MTAYELARKLLAGDDLPVELHVGTPQFDIVTADLGDCSVELGTIDVESAILRGYKDTQPGQCVMLRGWQSSEEPEDEPD